MRENRTANGDVLSQEAVDSLASMLKILANPTRIRLIEMLQSRGQATGSELTAHLPVGQQDVSHQLRVLHLAGMVARRPDGVWVRYELSDWSGWWLIRQLAVGQAGPTLDRFEPGPDRSNTSMREEPSRAWTPQRSGPREQRIPARRYNP